MKSIKSIKPTVILAAVVFVLIFSFDAFSKDIKTVQFGYLASTSENLLDRAVDYYIDNDNEAFNEIISTGLVFWLKSGVKVNASDNKIAKDEIIIKSVGTGLFSSNLIALK